jgi:hypothetical protein
MNLYEASSQGKQTSQADKSSRNRNAFRYRQQKQKRLSFFPQLKNKNKKIIFLGKISVSSWRFKIETRASRGLWEEASSRLHLVNPHTYSQSHMRLCGHGPAISDSQKSLQGRRQTSA